MLSAGRPVLGSVMATRLRHVSAAHVRTVARSRERTVVPGAEASRLPAALGRDPAYADGASARAAMEAAPPTISDLRLGVDVLSWWVMVMLPCWWGGWECSDGEGWGLRWRSLEPGRGDALDEALLEDEEDHEDRDDDDRRPGEEQAVVGAVLTGRVEGERDREGVVVLRLGHDEGPQEVVSAADEGEDPERREGG